ncbi:MAG: chorismate synthase [Candidatus Eremiobacteraeota bacterium]|nr:chorismate synthase [Candidatus Eremiobacteraeota bacterium]
MRLLTAGESHGFGLTGILEGLPAGIPVDTGRINEDLARRQAGVGRSERMKLERDTVSILGGIIGGKTYGGPLSLLITNRDNRNLPESGGDPHHVPRPGHADLTGCLKYGFNDTKMPAERASARNTAIFVAMGSVAKQFLGLFGIAVLGYTSAIGAVAASGGTGKIEAFREAVEASPLRCPSSGAEREMTALIEACREEGDTLGGIVTVLAEGMPAGLGSFVHYDRKLDGRLAAAVMSIPGIKGVELGDGFGLAATRGSEAYDPVTWEGRYRRSSNHAGGLEGGVTNGEPLVIRAVMKPIPTLGRGALSVDITTKRESRTQYVRSDVCAVPAAGVVAEAMTALVLMESFLEKFSGDTLEEVTAAYGEYMGRAGGS